MNTEQFVKEVNKLRLANKNQWYFLIGTVNGKDFKLKGYNNWLQIFEVNNWDCSNVMGQSVKGFKLHLQKMVDEAPNYKYETIIYG